MPIEYACRTCGAISDKKLCPKHRPRNGRGVGQKVPWAGSTRRKTLPPGWRRIQRRILERDPTCTVCGDAPSTDAHHIGHRDDHRDHMLRGVCRRCHLKITAREASLARWEGNRDRDL